MGHVKQYITSVISKRIDEKSIVLWYDPEQSYGDFAKTLELPNTHVARFTDSFFALRSEVEPFLSSADPSRLLVYVPTDALALPSTENLAYHFERFAELEGS